MHGTSRKQLIGGNGRWGIVKRGAAANRIGVGPFILFLFAHHGFSQNVCEK